MYLPSRFSVSEVHVSGDDIFFTLPSLIIREHTMYFAYYSKFLIGFPLCFGRNHICLKHLSWQLCRIVYKLSALFKLPLNVLILKDDPFLNGGL